MKEDKGFESLGSLFAIKAVKPIKKAPAHQFQDLALRVINELRVPNFKRGSVFKACKEHGREVIERAMNDTKELCSGGEQWKYFFKILSNISDKNKTQKTSS